MYILEKGDYKDEFKTLTDLKCSAMLFADVSDYLSEQYRDEDITVWNIDYYVWARDNVEDALIECGYKVSQVKE